MKSTTSKKIPSTTASTTTTTTTSTTTQRPSTTAVPDRKTYTDLPHTTQTEKTPLLTPKPLAIPPTVDKPEIVDDYHFDYNDPTLPPSLPNLKIIPFLPADAVKHDRTKPYDYGVERTSYPSITTDAYESLGHYDKTIDYSNSYVKEQLSHDIIKKGESFAAQNYPSITEPNDVITADKMEDKSDYDYLLEGYNLKKNGYGEEYMKNHFDVDVNSYMSFKSGPVYKKGTSVSVSNRVEPVAEITNVELRTESPEFGFDLNRFSPPKETEGGFQPRNPERVYNKYPIDITTEEPEELSGYNAIKNKYFPETKMPSKKVPIVDPNMISITTDRNHVEMKDIVDTLMPEMILHSDDAPKDPIPEFDLNKETESGGLFGDFFSLLFKEEEKTLKPEVQQQQKIEPLKEKFPVVQVPPFKSISQDFLAVELPTKKPEYDPLTVDVGTFEDQHNSHDRENENGTAIKNILLDLLGHGELGPPFNIASLASTTATPSTHAPPPPPPKQPLKFPVHSIPYIASNLHINPRPLEPVRNNLDSLLSESNKVGQKYGQVLSDDINLTSSNSKSDYVVNPLNLETLKRHQSEKPAKIYSKPLLNKNDMGLLKLAGCNIYGRMYRVGRIISELSGPCLQCMCEEVGVHCTPLEC